MKRLMSLLVLVCFCLVAIGCQGPVEEVKAFLNAKDDALLEISRTLEANPTEAGVDAARQAFDAKKEDLKAKRAVLKEKHLEKYGDLNVMIMDGAVTHGKMFMDIMAKFSVACREAQSFEQCEAAKTKLVALERDFSAV